LGSSLELTTVVAHEPLDEVQDTDSDVAQVETRTTWREALLARLRPVDHHVSDEDIFIILNDDSQELTAADLCANSGVTVPMYCVWKSKYRQLTLDELREARRGEQRRRYTMIGLTLFITTLAIGGVIVGLSWAMLSAFTASTAASSATATPAAGLEPSRVSRQPQPEPVAEPATTMAPFVAQSRPRTQATTAETGYRIQVTAAETEQEGRDTVAQLLSAGYPAYMTTAVVGNKNVFRVRVGPFETFPAAEKIAEQLRSAGYAGTWIAR
jgi:cell division septation protein DedD